MKIKITWFCTLLLLAGCNIYSPFAQNGSTEDLIEEGRKCLHSGDFDCAIEAYNKIPNTEARYHKLCEVYLSKSGMTLRVLINTLTSGNSTILGGVAKAMMPWSQAKQDAADLAKTNCDAYYNITTAGNAHSQSVLLQTIALFGHCAIRMARTDVYVGSSDGDTTCTTAGNGNGILSASDISDNTNGTITAAGMCSAHATECNTDIAAVDATGLGDAGLTDIRNGYLNIPAALRTAGATADTSRAGLRNTID